MPPINTGKCGMEWLEIRRCAGNRGQAMLESALVLVMISLLFFGMMQVMLAYHADQVQSWAAYAGARSRIVGFNDAVVEKAWLIANILNSGAMLTPNQGLSSVAQVGVELEAIPVFLQSAGTAWELEPQLNYAQWNNLPALPPATTADAYTVDMDRTYPMAIAQMIPMLYASFGVSNMTLHSEVTLENHFPFYLQVN
ncbi:MAG: pilus assembly protein [Verrucomicrobia bacterium]|nr:pilus assembly protein [Verrucomicrobiota bacterium]